MYTVSLGKMAQKVNMEAYLDIMHKRILRRMEAPLDDHVYINLNPYDMSLDLYALRELRDILDGYFDSEALDSLEQTLEAYEPERIFCQQLAEYLAGVSAFTLLKHWREYRRVSEKPTRDMLLDVVRVEWRRRLTRLRRG